MELSIGEYNDLLNVIKNAYEDIHKITKEEDIADGLNIEITFADNKSKPALLHSYVTRAYHLNSVEHMLDMLSKYKRMSGQTPIKTAP